MSELSAIHIEELLCSYKTLELNRKALATSILNEAPQAMVLPTYVGNISGEPQAAAESLTEIWNLDPGETRADAGLLCASGLVIEKTVDLNESKKRFQQAVAVIRALSSDAAKKSSIDKLMLRALSDNLGRSEELKQALANAHISRLNLTRCYRQIRILPPKLESISWTWAKSHSEIKEVSMTQALEMADNLLSEETRRQTIAALNSITNKHEIFAHKKDKPNQLRANIVFDDDGLRKRKAITISGIVLCPDPALPRYVWRDNPALVGFETDRLTRSDKRIESEPFIQVLHLHRYKSQA